MRVYFYKEKKKTMKKLILVLLCALMFVSCAKKATYNDRSFGSKSFINLELVAETPWDQQIYKDTNTGVLYLILGYRMTAIMEADGTCLTWDEWTKRINTTN